MSGLLFFVPGAYAHKVNLFAYGEGDQVYVQGYFADGKMAKDSKVTVYGPGDDLLLEGQTNGEGEFSFKRPVVAPFRVVLNAGMGHQAEYDFDADAESEGSAAAGPGPAVSGAALPGDAQLRAIVEKAVAEGVKPLARELSQLRERTTFADIIGGVGFIVGILGVFAYFQAKRR